MKRKTVGNILVTIDIHLNHKEQFILDILHNTGPIHGRTKFQKIIFIGQEELGFENVFTFDQAYHGPYAQDLSDTIDDLILKGLISEDVTIYDDIIRHTYQLSKSSNTQLDEKITIGDMDTLKKLNKIPQYRILDYVFRKHAKKINI